MGLALAKERSHLTEARELMTRFAERTGLAGDRPPERYLWTDAFAVCNWLGLGERELALQMVDQVHRVLGRHRPDDPRHGWISGLSEADGEAHPTVGGLRIGKKLPERPEGEPFEEELEWDRDGQYFHYLTKWMHALEQARDATGTPIFGTWARELAQTAHGAFLHWGPGGGGMRMHWKMSIDLTRPLVASMGHHDPLDGYVTALQLGLDAEAADFAAMIPAEVATVDPLGLGGLLTDAYRVAQIPRSGVLPAGALLDRLLTAALGGLTQYARRRDRRMPAAHRLAFRELGLAIGLSAIEPMRALAPSALLDELAWFLPVRDDIEAFWQVPEHQRVPSWLGHPNINEVMLATALAPEGYLRLPGAR